MSTNSYLKIAFGLYDKNKNGIIDEDDLLQAVSLTRKMPQL
jgi:Ca2+-binding EF-hand superfamily protein